MSQPGPERYPDFVRWRAGNAIRLLQNGEEYFPALFNAIDNARFSVHLETYIFNLDDTGLKLLSHLRAACARGVRVRVVVDGFGSARHARVLAGHFEQMGARFRVYRPEPEGVEFYRFSLRRLRRLHRKVVVVDQGVAFVGGINVLDDLFDVPETGEGPQPRFDFAVQVKGPIVHDLFRAQSDLWMRMAWRHRTDWPAFYRRVRGWRRRRDQMLAQRSPPVSEGVRAAVLFRDNVRFRKTIESAYIGAIYRARHDVLIANSYFLPGKALKTALQAAAARGVRVRLLLQGQSEYTLQFRACRSMYGRLLSHGIEIYEYMPSYLHAKVAVIDGRAMVGSANMDPFSLLLAREANVYVDDAGFAALLQARLEAQLHQSSRLVTALHDQRRSWWTRFLDACAHRLVRLGVAITGRSAEY